MGGLVAALIDADIIAYIATAVTQTSIDWEDGEEAQVHASLPEAKRAFAETITKWFQPTGEDDYVLCWTDRKSPTFRYRIHPHYKAQRTGAKPLMLTAVEAWAYEEYPCALIDDLEGDDVLGLMMTDPSRGADCMVSTDKDLKTIPGRLYVPGKSKRPGTVRLDRADWWWMMQTIMGDKSDNFKGAPGAGEKRADGELVSGDDLSYLWDVVVSVFEDQFSKPKPRESFVTDDPYDEALMNARCARILRHGDYNYADRRVRLWTP